MGLEFDSSKATKLKSINMKAICQALIIFLILQSVKGSQVNSESPTNCFLCRVVLDLVMQVLDTDAGQDQIVAALESVCSLVPANLQPICTSFVETNIDQIVDVIQDNLGDSNNACYTLNACP